MPQFTWAPNNNIVPGSPGPFNLDFANQFEKPHTIIFKWAPNNIIDPGPINLIFVNQFKNTPNNNIQTAPI